MAAQTGLVDYIKRGAHDDSAEGVVLTKFGQAHLVKVPLGRSSELFVGGGGTATTAVSANASQNSDGTGRAITLTVPALTAGNTGQQGVYFEQTIYGPRVGVRFRRDAGASNYPFTIVVDGVAYAVRNVNSRRHAIQESYNDYEALFLIADDLGPGAHLVTVNLAADQVGGASRLMVFYGFVADRVGGYEDRRRLGVFPASIMQAMPTAETAIATTSTGGIRKLHWYNTDSASHTVTVRAGAGAANNVKVLTIAAGAHAEYDFGDAVGAATSSTQGFLKWLSDSALVTYLIQEAA